MRILFSDFARIFRTPKIYVSFAISMFIMLRPLFGAIINSTEGTLVQFLSVPFGMSDYSPFAAIFCVLPFADSFCEDYRAGYVNYIVARTGVKEYLRQRTLSVALSGGMLTGTVVFSTIIVCAFLANQPDTAETTAFMSGSMWARMNLILPYNGIFYLALKVLVAFLFGCVWSLVGLVISAFTANRYITYIGPFAVYQIAWFSLEQSAFNPVYMFRGDSEFIPSIWFLLCYQITIIIICSILSNYGMRKKVRI